MPVDSVCAAGTANTCELNAERFSEAVNRRSDVLVLPPNVKALVLRVTARRS